MTPPRLSSRSTPSMASPGEIVIRLPSCPHEDRSSNTNAGANAERLKLPAGAFAIRNRPSWSVVVLATGLPSPSKLFCVRMTGTRGTGLPFDVTRPLIDPEGDFESFDWRASGYAGVLDTLDMSTTNGRSRETLCMTSLLSTLRLRTFLRRSISKLVVRDSLTGFQINRDVRGGCLTTQAGTGRCVPRL